MLLLWLLFPLQVTWSDRVLTLASKALTERTNSVTAPLHYTHSVQVTTVARRVGIVVLLLLLRALLSAGHHGIELFRPIMRCCA